ncbi:periplasmic heme chaperone [Azospirillaceae bacterium]
MTRKKRRLYVLGLALFGIGISTALILSAFQDNIVFFYSPSDLKTKPVGDRRFRLGGMVENNSVQHFPKNQTTEFHITDFSNSVSVTYTGVLPDLFRENQGVIAEGSLRADGVFVAREVLAKHDENYMPPEVSDALKRAGTPQHTTKTLKH